MGISQCLWNKSYYKVSNIISNASGMASTKFQPRGFKFYEYIKGQSEFEVWRNVLQIFCPYDVANVSMAVKL